MKRERPPDGFRERYLGLVRSDRDTNSPLMRAVGWLIVLICVGTVAVEVSDIVTSSTSDYSMAELILVPIGALAVGFVVAWTLWNTRRGTRPLAEADANQSSPADGVADNDDIEERRDFALADTFTLIDDYVTGRADEIEAPPSEFSLRYDDEVVVAAGRYEMRWWGPIDEHATSSTGSRAAGAVATGAAAAPSGVLTNEQAEERARHRAEDRSRQWWAVDDGLLSLTNYGFYLSQGAAGRRRFGWDDIMTASMVTPGMVELTAATDDGCQTWRIVSDWAEALFALWAFTRNRSHPQWLDGSWYPYEGARELAVKAVELPPALDGRTDTAG